VLYVLTKCPPYSRGASEGVELFGVTFSINFFCEVVMCNLIDGTDLTSSYFFRTGNSLPWP
jgi:hypothetical protein